MCVLKYIPVKNQLKVNSKCEALVAPIEIIEWLPYGKALKTLGVGYQLELGVEEIIWG